MPINLFNKVLFVECLVGLNPFSPLEFLNSNHFIYLLLAVGKYLIVIVNKIQGFFRVILECLMSVNHCGCQYHLA